MTTAYWCIMVVMMMPYVLAPIGQLPGITYEGFKAPRARWESFTGWKLRANSAHLNGFEILPGFVAAVIIAHLSNAAQGSIDTLALTFVATRVAHAVFYIAGFALLRTIAWASGLSCIVALFIYAT